MKLIGYVIAAPSCVIKILVAIGASADQLNIISFVELVELSRYISTKMVLDRMGPTFGRGWLTLGDFE